MGGNNHEKFPKAIAALTLVTTCSAIMPVTALAAPPPYHRPPYQRHQGHNNTHKGTKAVLITAGTVGIIAAIVGSVKHHKANKPYKAYRQQ